MLLTKPKALYDLISERSNEFTNGEPIFFGVQLLEDLEPTYEQFKLITQKKNKNIYKNPSFSEGFYYI